MYICYQHTRGGDRIVPFIAYAMLGRDGAAPMLNTFVGPIFGKPKPVISPSTIVVIK